jgi:hypothetical protein
MESIFAVSSQKELKLLKEYKSLSETPFGALFRIHSRLSIFFKKIANVEMDFVPAKAHLFYELRNR